MGLRRTECCGSSRAMARAGGAVKGLAAHRWVGRHPGGDDGFLILRPLTLHRVNSAHKVGS